MADFTFSVPDDQVDNLNAAMALVYPSGDAGQPAVVSNEHTRACAIQWVKNTISAAVQIRAQQQAAIDAQNAANQVTIT